MRTLLRCVASILGCACLAAAPTSAGAEDAPPRLCVVGVYRSGAEEGTEILSVQACTRRAALTNSSLRLVEILSLADPAQPVRVARHALALAPGESPTSVAFHPTHDYVLVAVQATGPAAAGRVLVLMPADGRVLREVPVGVGPDCVVIGPDGARAVVANEAEAVWLEEGVPRSAPGSVSVLDLDADPQRIRARTIPLTDLTGKPGFVRAEDKRKLERPIDLDGNGRIEGADELRAKVPLLSCAPAWLEPEYVAIAPGGRRAFVTLQENNGVLVVDLVQGRVERAVGLGVTRHAADVQDDGTVAFTGTLEALREPDGVAVTTDGRWFVTADEGDTDPQAGKTNDGPTGGGRTISVFDAQTGRLLGDTGNQLDEAAHRAGAYPDDRSDDKGSEPETVQTIRRGGVEYAIVALERANALALVSLADPARPRVLAVTPLAPGDKGPEGLAILEVGGRTWVYTANEASGTVTVLALE